jgi:quercetin dioxygenase-like cupin family protein
LIEFLGSVDYYFGNKDQVKQEEVKVKGSKGAYIQWLVTKDVGSSRYAVRRFTVKPGGLIAHHIHKYEEAVYIISGSTEVCVGREKRSMKRGDFVFIKGDVPHSFMNRGEEDLEFICVIPYIEDMSITPLDWQC